MRTSTRTPAILFPLIIAAVGLISGVCAGENTAMRETAIPHSTARSASTDDIFNGIMQTLPASEKAQVDSARSVTVVKTPTRFDTGTTVVRPGAGDAAAKQAEREKALGQLSPELRRQVEQAIQDMKTSTEERRARMKESAVSPAR